MAKYASIIFVSAFVVVGLANQADALKCFRCSSDATNSEYCRDPFQPEHAQEGQRRWHYVDCSFPPSQGTYGQGGTRPVCMKMKQIIGDREVVSRSCAWEDINSPSDACMHKNTASYIKTEFCETCTQDGCNGAEQYGPVFLTVAALAIVAKLLAL